MVGADVQTVDDECMSIYAPSRDIMDDVKERLEAMMEDVSLAFPGNFQVQYIHIHIDRRDLSTKI